MALATRMTADDYLVINWNQPELEALSAKSKAKIILFHQEKVAGAYMLDGMLYYKEEAIMAAEELGVPGAHNIENALAAIAVGKTLRYVERSNQTSVTDLHWGASSDPVCHHYQSGEIFQ